MFDKLNFLTAGMPLTTGKGGYSRAFKILKEMELDGMELEFVHGVRMNDDTRSLVKEERKSKNLILTCHAPFYVNLNAREEEKVDASVQRIFETAAAARDTGAFSITFHAAYYLGQEKELVYNQVKAQIARLVKLMKKEKFKVWIRPETTGKATQWGDLDEIIAEVKAEENKEQAKMYTNDIRIGNTVTINDNARIYVTAMDAINEINQYRPREENTGKDRVVTGVTVDVEGNRVNLFANQENVNEQIDTLVNGGGKIVSVLTSIKDDLPEFNEGSMLSANEINDKSEGFYNINSVNVNTMERMHVR